MQRQTSRATSPALRVLQPVGGRRCARPWFRLLLAALLLAPITLLQGCWVYSVHSLYEDDFETVFDPSLLGYWKQPEGGCVLLITDSGDGAYQVQYVAPVARQEDDCLLEPGASASFDGRLLQVGGQLFLDVVPTEREVRHHNIRVHSFFKVTLDAQSLALVPLNPDWFKQALESGQLELGALAENNGVYVITAPSAELRAFLRDYGDNDEAFGVQPSFLYRKQTSS